MKQQSPYQQSSWFNLTGKEQKQIQKNQRMLGVLDAELRRNMESLQRQF